MAPRKRDHAEMAAADSPPRHVEPTLLERIRNMSEFAALMQYLFFFGKAVKAEELDVEDFEQECLLPTNSVKISELGVALLKMVSSHRGLTVEIFDEYTRRQYLAKAPERNPFGTDEEPLKFADFDVFTKIRILHQLSVWTFWNPDKIREKMPEFNPEDQSAWRIDPCGWDAEERTYFLFDDDRLYRQTDAPLPSTPKKGRSTKSSRSSKRQRLSRVIPDTSPEDSEAEKQNGADPLALDHEENFAGRKWECVAVTLEDYNRFLDTIRRSRHPDEKNLLRLITSDVIPLLNEREEERQRKEMRKLRELENQHKLATAKRSSRLATKFEKKKEQEDAEEAERKKLADLEMAHRELARQQKMEEDRESRMMTREQRIREREMKRILHEEELAKEQEMLKRLAEQPALELSDGAKARVSRRQLDADMERHKMELEKLQGEDDWMFDCSVCGVHGQNWDDGTHSVACEKCSVWQHSACHGIPQHEAEKEEFHFVCKACNYRMQNPGATLKIKLGPKAAEEPKRKRGRPRKYPLPTEGLPASTKSPLVPRKKKMLPVDDLDDLGPPGSGVFNGVIVPPSQAPKPALIYPGPPPQPPSSTGPAVPGYQGPPAEHLPHNFTPSSPPPATYDYYANNFVSPPSPVAGARFGSPTQTSKPSNGWIAAPKVPSSPSKASQPHASNGYPPRPSSGHGSQPYSTPHSSQHSYNSAPASSPNGQWGRPVPYTPSVTGLRAVSGQHSPPVPVLPSPRQPRGSPSTSFTASFHGAGKPALTLQGSPPGFSPVKHDVPPSPPPVLGPGAMAHSQQGGAGGVMHPPVALEPDRREQILTPPVKKAVASAGPSPGVALSSPAPVVGQNGSAGAGA